MDRSDVYENIIKVVCDVMEADPSSISEATTFADLKADSLDQVELMMAIEQEFDIELSDEAIEKIGSVADALDAVIAAMA